MSWVAAISVILESNWLRSSWVCLTITKQKQLISSLALRMSSHVIMSSYMLNIPCFMSIEFSKVLQSDWLRIPLATSKNSEKSNIHFQCSSSQPGRKTERRLDRQKTNISQNHHTHRSNETSKCWLLLKRLFWSKPKHYCLPLVFLEEFFL